MLLSKALNLCQFPPCPFLCSEFCLTFEAFSKTDPKRYHTDLHFTTSGCISLGLNINKDKQKCNAFLSEDMHCNSLGFWRTAKIFDTLRCNYYFTFIVTPKEQTEIMTEHLLLDIVNRSYLSSTRRRIITIFLFFFWSSNGCLQFSLYVSSAP